ncbi:hypothetical protein F5Y16DRAFT_379102 [Xylariaceae sp. FL0255]|nr:hypothetical protein F5Y16DRAFT_379102 [Xylariaceae sp. FL0255]
MKGLLAVSCLIRHSRALLSAQSVNELRHLHFWLHPHVARQGPIESGLLWLSLCYSYSEVIKRNGLRTDLGVPVRAYLSYHCQSRNESTS